MNNRKETEQRIYTALLERGTKSTRDNVMAEFTAEKLGNPIYVRKLPVNIPVKETVCKMVSIASEQEDFSDAAIENIRLGFENGTNLWSNLYIHEVSDDILEAIAKHL